MVYVLGEDKLEEPVAQVAKLSPLLKVNPGLDLKSREAKKYRIKLHPAMVIKGGAIFMSATSESIRTSSWTPSSTPLFWRQLKSLN